MTIELVIFDCDGVLVDSEPLANQVFARVLKEECGLSLTLEYMFQEFMGRSVERCMEKVAALLGHEPPIGLPQRYHGEINAALAQSVEPVAGIEDVIAQLQLPFCVASSGSYEKMQTTLGRTGLLHFFEGRLFSTSDVSRGKPFPDIYLHAATQMGKQAAENCLVVEDTPTGVKGAIAAGMKAFGYSALVDASRLMKAGANRTFDDMSKLADLIREVA